MKETSSTCECCGKVSKVICGDVSIPGKTLAIYYVQWTTNSAEHFPTIDLILGPWDAGDDPRARVLISLVYDSGPDGGGFTVIDSETRPANTRELCGRALRRDAVIGTPFAQEAFQLVDAIWLHDPRIDEVRNFNSHR